MMQGMQETLVRTMIALVLFMMAGLLAVAVFVLLLVALFVVVDQAHGPAAAATTLAGTCLLIALILAGVGVVLLRRPNSSRRPRGGRRDGGEARAAGPSGGMAEDPAGWVREGPLEAVVTAFVAGLIYALSPSSRPIVERFFGVRGSDAGEPEGEEDPADSSAR